ncbi:hypothetical protein M434DRAFT_17958 [Hypoxylon sp. CO27-5]|nr:hypothetical protein M434DRAFT_17958 [Hypoxylon sp. CO27-5]
MPHSDTHGPAMETLPPKFIWAIIAVVTYETLIAVQTILWTKGLFRGRWFQGVRLPKRSIYRILCAPFIWLSAFIAISILAPFYILYLLVTEIPRLGLWCTDEAKEDRDLEKGYPAGHYTRAPGRPGRNQCCRKTKKNTRRKPCTTIKSYVSTQPFCGHTISNLNPPPPAYIPKHVVLDGSKYCAWRQAQFKKHSGRE